jgi:hypothetical protein
VSFDGTLKSFIVSIPVCFIAHVANIDNDTRILWIKYRAGIFQICKLNAFYENLNCRFSVYAKWSDHYDHTVFSFQLPSRNSVAILLRISNFRGSTSVNRIPFQTRPVYESWHNCVIVAGILHCVFVCVCLKKCTQFSTKTKRCFESNNVMRYAIYHR